MEDFENLVDYIIKKNICNFTGVIGIGVGSAV
jgi:hypothetical protein